MSRALGAACVLTEARRLRASAPGDRAGQPITLSVVRQAGFAVISVRDRVVVKFALREFT
ncbi:hypothetical protein WMF27_05045 [Sorangium sp. So ce281]|uniref:hypothetical protein n=1 Tax=unclassified Sorangium TaxID=2621164 RepID=UPI003F61619D